MGKKNSGPLPGAYRNFLNTGDLSGFFSNTGGSSDLTLKIQGLIFDEPPGVWVFCPINPRYLTRIFFPPWFGPTLMTASVRCTSPPRAPVTSESLETALRSGRSCQENKRILVKIQPQRNRDPTSGPKKKSDRRQKCLCEPVRRPRGFETRVKSGGMWR